MAPKQMGSDTVQEMQSAGMEIGKVFEDFLRFPLRKRFGAQVRKTGEQNVY